MRSSLLVALVLCAPLLASARDTVPPAMLADPAKLGEDGVVTIVAQIVDESGVFDPTVYWRVAGTKEFDVAKMAGEKQEFRATVSPPPGAALLEYYIEAYDSEGNGPARFGAPNLPVKLDLAAARKALQAAAAPPPPPVAKAPPAKPATPASPKGATTPPKAAAKPPAKTASNEVPAGAAPVAGPQPVPGDPKHEMEISTPMPEWKFWSIVGAGAAGVALVAGGAALLSSARGDAAAFNDRFNREGFYDDARASSITNMQRGSVALMSVGVLALGAGATLYVVDF